MSYRTAAVTLAVAFTVRPAPLVPQHTRAVLTVGVWTVGFSLVGLERNP
jgi:hypothetical protein